MSFFSSESVSDFHDSLYGRKESEKTITFRRKNTFAPEEMISKVSGKISIEKHTHCEHYVMTEKCVKCFSAFYSSTLKQYYNDARSIPEKEIIIKDHAPWFNVEIPRA